MMPALPWWAWLVIAVAVLYYLRTKRELAGHEAQHDFQRELRGDVEIGDALVGEREIRRARGEST